MESGLVGEVILKSRGLTMRLRLVVGAMFVAGCASQQPSGLSDTKSQTNKDRDRDLYECERESAFAGAGDKRQVFDKCMKARGY